MTSHHPCILGGFLDRYNTVVLTFDGGAFEHIFDLFSSTLMAFIVQTGEKYKNVLVCMFSQCMFVEMSEHGKKGRGRVATAWSE